MMPGKERHKNNQWLVISAKQRLKRSKAQKKWSIMGENGEVHSPTVDVIKLRLSVHILEDMF